MEGDWNHWMPLPAFGFGTNTLSSFINILTSSWSPQLFRFLNLEINLASVTDQMDIVLIHNVSNDSHLSVTRSGWMLDTRHVSIGSLWRRARKSATSSATTPSYFWSLHFILKYFPKEINRSITDSRYFPQIRLFQEVFRMTTWYRTKNEKDKHKWPQKGVYALVVSSWKPSEPVPSSPLPSTWLGWACRESQFDQSDLLPKTQLPSLSASPHHLIPRDSCYVF